MKLEKNEEDKLEFLEKYPIVFFICTTHNLRAKF